MHEVLNWFESRSLAGRRIVVTRSREQASVLVRLLEESGAQVVQIPTIEIAPPESFESLDRIIDAVSTYHWLIFTSTNGIRGFFDRMLTKGKDARALGGLRIAVVGETTASELRARGIAPDLVPEKFQSAALLPHFAQSQEGIRTAVIRAAEGREELIGELRRRGGTVDLGVAYRTRAADFDLGELRDLIAGNAIDVVTFTSSSTVKHFFERLTGAERERLLARALLASIGPATGETIRKYGRLADLEAKNATAQGLHDAIVEHYSGAPR